MWKLDVLTDEKLRVNGPFSVNLFSLPELMKSATARQKAVSRLESSLSYTEDTLCLLSHPGGMTAHSVRQNHRNKLMCGHTCLMKMVV